MSFKDIENSSGDDEQPEASPEANDKALSMSLIHEVVGDGFAPLDDDYGVTYAIIHNHQTFISVRLAETLCDD